MYPHIQSHSSRNEDTPLLAAGFFISASAGLRPDKAEGAMGMTKQAGFRRTTVAAADTGSAPWLLAARAAIKAIGGMVVLFVNKNTITVIRLVRQPGWLPNKSCKMLRVSRFLAEIVRKLRFPNNSIIRNPQKPSGMTCSFGKLKLRRSKNNGMGKLYVLISWAYQAAQV
jgi:hypothetical protein